VGAGGRRRRAPQEDDTAGRRCRRKARQASGHSLKADKKAGIAAWKEERRLGGRNRQTGVAGRREERPVPRSSRGKEGEGRCPDPQGGTVREETEGLEGEKRCIFG